MAMRFLVIASLLVVALGCTPAEQTSYTVTPQDAAQTAAATAVPASTATPQSRVAVASLLLQITAPVEEEVTVMQPSVEVRGKTVLDAVVTINGEVIPVDASGEFSADVELEPGPNTVTIVASDFQGNEQARMLTVIYVP